LAKANNTQLICLTAINDPLIYTYFPVVYSLNASVLAGKEYLQATLERGGYSIAPLNKERINLQNQLNLLE
jgi:hypothetical protein